MGLLSNVESLVLSLCLNCYGSAKHANRQNLSNSILSFQCTLKSPCNCLFIGLGIYKLVSCMLNISMLFCICIMMFIAENVVFLY